MALTASKVSSSPMVNNRTTISRSRGSKPSFAKGTEQSTLHPFTKGIDFRQLNNGHLRTKSSSYFEGLWNVCGKPGSYVISRGSLLCMSTGRKNTGTKECVSARVGDEEAENLFIPKRTIDSSQGLAEACKFAQNDAKFVNKRARKDMVLLSRGIMRLDARARQDVAILGMGFLKLDARAREDTKKIDRNMKKKAERLHYIATILKHKAGSRLKSAADQHWSDGALEADLRRADFRAKQRAMEDALMALEFVKNIIDMMVSKMYRFPLSRDQGSISANDKIGHITLEKNGKNHNFSGEVSTDRISAIQEAYLSMASALYEADGIDYTDPEELELVVATLIDLDAMDGKSSVSLLAECSSSPDVNTRQALANALAAAPSMWTLGNAGMGALQRLAEDRNPAIAIAASRAIYELKKQWEIEEGDNWRFMMNLNPTRESNKLDDVDDDGAIHK